MKLKVLKKQNGSRDCIVCGKESEASLRADFYELAGEVLACPFVARNEHQSYPGRMHGGMISAVLDETIGRAVNIREPDTWGVTGELKVRFKAPVPLGEPLLAVAVITKNIGRLFVGKGHIEDREGRILATAEATYMKLPMEQISTSPLYGWGVYPDAEPVEWIEVKGMDGYTDV